VPLISPYPDFFTASGEVRVGMITIWNLRISF